jgi:TolB protein
MTSMNRMLLRRRHVCAALAGTAASLAMTPARAQFRVEISGVGATQIPVAVARFRDDEKASPSLGVASAIVRADLERSGLFRLLDVPGVLEETAQPSMSEWRGRGADALVGGSVSRLADGRLDLRYKLWDVVKGQDLGGQSYVVPLADMRLAAHRIADYIYEKLTGEKGVFSTRIAYVTRPPALHAVGGRRRRRKRAGGAVQPRAHHFAGLVARRRAAGLCVVRIAQAVVRARRGHRQRRLLANFRGSNSAPAWSPDGRNWRSRCRATAARSST